MFLLKKRPLHSAQRIERIKKRFIYFSLAGTLLFLGGVAALSWASRREEINITSIHVSGVESFSKEEIRSFVEKKLSGTYFYLFNRANSFLYPRKRIEAELMDAFPRLANVSVARTSLRELIVNTKEREPLYLWCGEKPPARDIRPHCYFLDPEGIVFARAPYFSGNIYFKLYGKMGGENIFQHKKHEPPVGLSFLPFGDFARIISFKNALAESGISVEKLVAEETGDAFFIFPSGLRLIFSMTQDFNTVLFNLLAALDTESLTREMFSLVEENHYEYMDARFENRIFYK